MKLRFLFPFLLASFFISAQALTDEIRQEVDRLVMADIPDGGPGAAVGIIRNGEIIYEKYAGLADVKNKRSISSATRFNLASNAKQFTSVRALQLIDAGKLKLDEDIRRFFPGLYADLDTPITVRQLINHTSGLRDVYDLWSIQGYTWYKKKFTNADAVELLIKQRDLNFPPGTRHLYSNSNYILLAEIISQIEGKSFREDMDDFFKSLGFTATAFRDNAKVEVPNMALPYFNFDKWITYDLPTTVHGDGALFGNLQDQLLWETTVQTGKSPALSPDQIRRSQLPLDQVTDYAYGLENDTYRNTPVRYHDGSTGAWKASTLRFHEQKITIVVLNNSGKFGTNYLARQIADALLFPDAQPAKYALEPATIGPDLKTSDILGTYVINGSYFYRYLMREGQLFLERPNRNPVAIEWEKGNVFHEIKDPAFKQAFTTNEAGLAIVTAYYPREEPYSLTKIDFDRASYDFDGITGEYANDELGVTTKITHLGKGNYKIKTAKIKREVQMSVPDVLRFRGSPLSIERNEAGSVTALIYNDGRVLNLRFSRVE